MVLKTKSCNLLTTPRRSSPSEAIAMGLSFATSPNEPVTLSQPGPKRLSEIG